MATAIGTPIRSANAEVMSVPTTQRQRLEGIAGDVPVVAEDEVDPELREGRLRLDEEADEEVREEGEDRERKTQEAPLEGLVGEGGERRPPLQGAVVASDSELPCLHASGSVPAEAG